MADIKEGLRLDTLSHADASAPDTTLEDTGLLTCQTAGAREYHHRAMVTGTGATNHTRLRILAMLA